MYMLRNNYVLAEVFQCCVPLFILLVNQATEVNRFSALFFEKTLGSSTFIWLVLFQKGGCLANRTVLDSVLLGTLRISTEGEDELLEGSVHSRNMCLFQKNEMRIFSQHKVKYFRLVSIVSTSVQQGLFLCLCFCLKDGNSVLGPAFGPVLSSFYLFLTTVL